MTQARSPGYPGMPLNEAIEIVRKVHSHNRTNPIDREAAAKDMGYTGLTGRSSKVLSDLSHFGLLEKAGKGGVRVSRTAVDILHPESSAGRLAALREAAYSPTLFNELHSHFADGLPSENSLRSYLVRQGFVDAAIQPALTSFLETYRYLEQEGATESHGGQEEKAVDSEGSNDKAGGPVVGGGVPASNTAPPVGPNRETPLMSGERVIFADEAASGSYVKLVAAGEFDSSLLEAVEDFTKRWRKRLGLVTSTTSKPPAGAEDDLVG